MTPSPVCYSFHMPRRRTTGSIAGVLNFLLIAGSVCAASATQQADSHKGLTVEDLARGLRGAAQNIEKEIPKIGPAIGKTVKSITGNSSAKTQPQDTPSPNKK